MNRLTQSFQKNNNSDYFDCCGLKLNKRNVTVVATATVGLAALVGVYGQEKIAMGVVKCLDQFTSIMTTYATDLLFTSLFYLGSLILTVVSKRDFSEAIIILGVFFWGILTILIMAFTFCAKVSDFYHEGLFTVLDKVFTFTVMMGVCNLLNILTCVQIHGY